MNDQVPQPQFLRWIIVFGQVAWACGALGVFLGMFEFFCGWQFLWPLASRLMVVGILGFFLVPFVLFPYAIWQGFQKLWNRPEGRDRVDKELDREHGYDSPTAPPLEADGDPEEGADSMRVEDRRRIGAVVLTMAVMLVVVCLLLPWPFSQKRACKAA